MHITLQYKTMHITLQYKTMHITLQYITMHITLQYKTMHITLQYKTMHIRSIRLSSVVKHAMFYFSTSLKSEHKETYSRRRAKVDESLLGNNRKDGQRQTEMEDLCCQCQGHSGQAVSKLLTPDRHSPIYSQKH